MRRPDSGRDLRSLVFLGVIGGGPGAGRAAEGKKDDGDRRFRKGFVSMSADNPTDGSHQSEASH